MDKETRVLERYLGNERLNAHFQRYQYDEFMIYKHGTWWFVWDNEISQTIMLYKTLKQIKREIDQWKTAMMKNGAK